jgi:hypothetical protein
MLNSSSGTQPGATHDGDGRSVSWLVLPMMSSDERLKLYVPLSSMVAGAREAMAASICCCSCTARSAGLEPVTPSMCTSSRSDGSSIRRIRRAARETRTRSTARGEQMLSKGPVPSVEAS